ncbi:hypothetical protein FBEOM_5928 [Fusarium beomiforme]|uniref:Uncharacterized protein n=1 Tax=Fusarium beomiforme TaxID=44412 RepID=A0A9P5AKF2_9HYPO|nr:hypothetical protein FBEOM_5928 [Fusarium beomiforme]
MISEGKQFEEMERNLDNTTKRLEAIASKMKAKFKRKSKTKLRRALVQAKIKTVNAVRYLCFKLDDEVTPNLTPGMWAILIMVTVLAAAEGKAEVVAVVMEGEEVKVEEAVEGSWTTSKCQ